MKAKRHAKILEIIRKYDVDTQEELCVRLNEAGYKVTQATVSRDIRELKLTKVAIKGGKQKYTSLYDVGSIAGDDTIMCAVRTVEDTAALMQRLRALQRE